MQDLNLALWQTPYAECTAQALRGLDQAAADSQAQGTDLLLCPEMGLTGYAIGAERVAALAEKADGPMAQAVAAIAQRHQIAIVYGYPEQHPEDQKPFNAAQAIDHQGQPIGRYRKTHLFGDMDRQQFTAGDNASHVFEYKGWRLGLLICYDVEFPETVRLLALQGADAVLVPTANMVGYEEVPNLLVPARACENRLYVAYANACGSEHQLSYGGLSTVAQPDGRTLGQAGAQTQTLLVKLDARALAQARLSGQLTHRSPTLYQPLSTVESDRAQR
jgi:5-aminopentanamidase